MICLAFHSLAVGMLLHSTSSWLSHQYLSSPRWCSWRGKPITEIASSRRPQIPKLCTPGISWWCNPLADCDYEPKTPQTIISRDTKKRIGLATLYMGMKLIPIMWAQGLPPLCACSFCHKLTQLRYCRLFIGPDCLETWQLVTLLLG